MKGYLANDVTNGVVRKQKEIIQEDNCTVGIETSFEENVLEFEGLPSHIALGDSVLQPDHQIDVQDKPKAQKEHKEYKVLMDLQIKFYKIIQERMDEKKELYEEIQERMDRKKQLNKEIQERMDWKKRLHKQIQEMMDLSEELDKLIQERMDLKRKEYKETQERMDWIEELENEIQGLTC